MRTYSVSRGNLEPEVRRPAEDGPMTHKQNNQNRLRAMAEGRQKAQEARSRLPKCTIPVMRGEPAIQTPCGQRTSQNEAEQDRGVYWCPRCQKYPWGSGGGRSGGGRDKVPAEAWA